MRIVVDPFMASTDESELAWVLEGHAIVDPYGFERAANIDQRLKKYGESLSQQLELEENLTVFAAELEGLPFIAMDVQDCGGQSLFHSLHWEALDSVPLGDSALELVIRRRINTSPSNIDHEKRRLRGIHRNFNILVVSAQP